MQPALAGLLTRQVQGEVSPGKLLLLLLLLLVPPAQHQV
jgi:hypothetical protein